MPQANVRACNTPLQQQGQKCNDKHKQLSLQKEGKAGDCTQELENVKLPVTWPSRLSSLCAAPLFCPPEFISTGLHTWGPAIPAYFVAASHLPPRGQFPTPSSLASHLAPQQTFQRPGETLLLPSTPHPGCFLPLLCFLIDGYPIRPLLQLHRALPL